MTPLIAITVALIAAVLTLEAITASVFGWYAPKEIIEKLLAERWDDYMNNGTSRPVDMFYGSADLPAIWKSPVNFTSSWYISEIGRIPRWSKWHKKLNEAQAIMKELRRREFLKSIGL